MKNIFTRFCIITLVISVCTPIKAVDLNPFAYRIDNIVEKSGTDIMNDHIIINYSLSGQATAGWIRLWDISDDANPKSTWTREGWKNSGTCLAEFPLTGDYLKKGAHTYTVDFTDVIGLNENNIQWQKVRWTIDVQGGNQNEETTTVIETRKEATGMTFYGNTQTDFANDVITYTNKQHTVTYINAQRVSTTWDFYYPGGIDICTNPYYHNFGVILCPESKKVTKAFDAPALYAFGGAMEHLPTYYNNVKHNGYGGGLAWGVTAEDWAGTYPYYAFGPHRVRMTDDGRVFVSALLKGNKFFYEVTKPANADGNNFYESTKGGSFTNVFPGNTFDSNLALLKNSSGTFVVGPNMAFDVRGTGSALELLLLSANKNGIIGSNEQSAFRIDKYPLGNNGTITTAPTTQGTANLLYTTSQNQVTVKPHNASGAMIIGHDNTSIEYDPLGGFWMVQCRVPNSGALAMTMVHRTKNGVWELEEHAMRRGKGGVRHNYDNTKLAVAGGLVMDTIMHVYDNLGTKLHENYYKNKRLATDGRAYKTKVADRHQITIWDVSYDQATGAASLTNPKYINTGNLRGIKDFAWDFADNLYVVDPNIEVLTAFALPHKGKTVSTPARDVFNYTLAPVYDVSVKFNPVVAGTSYGYVKQTNRTNKTPNGEPYNYYMHNANIELTAVNIPKGCRFYKWTNVHSNAATVSGNKLTLTALNKEADITAHVGLCVYEDTTVMPVTHETTFPASFVRRELDNQSYSTICLPFQLTSLLGTPYEGATVLRFAGAVPSSQENDRKVYLNFQEVTFTGDDYMHAGVPYLIKLNNNIAAGAAGEAIFLETLCPILEDLNEYGGKSVTFNGITFHGIMSPTTFNASESNLFMTADNRLVTLYDKATINGLRAYFEVHSPMGATEFVLNLPGKTTTNVETITLPTQQKPTKYLWNGNIYIQQGNNTYDISSKRVK